MADIEGDRLIDKNRIIRMFIGLAVMLYLIVEVMIPFVLQVRHQEKAYVCTKFSSPEEEARFTSGSEMPAGKLATLCPKGYRPVRAEKSLAQPAP